MTNPDSRGNLTKLSDTAAGFERERQTDLKKIRKKFLTKERGRGKMAKLNFIVRDCEAGAKKSEKDLKKVLDKAG